MRSLKHVLMASAFLLVVAMMGAAERKKLGDLPAELHPKNKDQAAPVPEPTTTTEKPLEDDVAEEFYQKGLKALNAGDIEQAEGLFDRALVIKPNHKGAQEGIAYIMQTLEDPKPVATPPKPDPKAILLEQLKKNLEGELAKQNWDEANTMAAKMLAIDPNNAFAKSKLPGIKQKLHAAAVDRAKEQEAAGDYAGAVDAYRTAQSYWNDPIIPEAITRLHKKMAQAKLDQSDALYVQALQKSQEGKTEEALQLCKQSLELNPDNFQAQRMLDRLQPRPTK